MGKTGTSPGLKRFILPVSCIVLAGTVPYIRVISKGFFILDDSHILLIAKNLSFWRLFNFYQWHLQFIRPLVNIFWKLEYTAFGLNSQAFHAVPVAMNIINALLLFFIAGRLSRDRLVGFFSGLVFVAHPLHAEAVSWLSAQYDLFCAVFFLGALACFIVYVEDGRRPFAPAALLLFLLGLLSKEGVVVLPFVLLAYDLLWHGTAGLKKRLNAHLAFFGILIFYTAFRLTALGGMGGPGHILNKTVAEALMAVFGTAPYYLLSPVGGVLYKYSALIFAGALLVILSLSFLARDSFRKEYALPVFSLTFIIISCLPAAPVLKIWPGYLGNGRILYLASAGYCIILAWLLAAALRKTERLKEFVAFSAAVLGVSYGLMLYHNCTPWINNSLVARQAYTRLKEVVDKSRWDTVILIKKPGMPKGLDYLLGGSLVFTGLLTTDEKAVTVYPLGTEEEFKNAFEAVRPFGAEKRAKMTGIAIDPACYANGTLPIQYVSDVKKIVGGVATPEALGLDAALVEWDEAGLKANKAALGLGLGVALVERDVGAGRLKVLKATF